MMSQRFAQNFCGFLRNDEVGVSSQWGRAADELSPTEEMTLVQVMTLTDRAGVVGPGGYHYGERRSGDGALIPRIEEIATADAIGESVACPASEGGSYLPVACEGKDGLPPRAAEILEVDTGSPTNRGKVLLKFSDREVYFNPTSEKLSRFETIDVDATVRDKKKYFILSEISDEDLESIEAGDPEKIEQIDHLEHIKILNYDGLLKLGRIVEGLPYESFKTSRLSPTVRGSENLTGLEKLNADGCGLTGSLDVSNLTSLKVLNLYSNQDLREIRGLENLTFLEELQAYKCSLIGPLDVSNLTSLKVLSLGENKDLREIRGLENLTLLEKLETYGCGLTGPLDVSNLTSLKVLDLSRNKDLREIRGLENLILLDELRVFTCGLTGSMDVSNLLSLRILDCGTNSNLNNVIGLGNLTNLESLGLPFLPCGESPTI